MLGCSGATSAYQYFYNQIPPSLPARAQCNVYLRANQANRVTDGISNQPQLFFLRKPRRIGFGSQQTDMGDDKEDGGNRGNIT
jgi:hypothetical protein